MSLLTILQTAAEEVGITAPTYVVNSSDAGVRNLYRLANRDGRNLAARHPWQVLVKEATFTTAATEIQSAVATVAPGFKWVVDDTIWNRTLRRPVFGPVSLQRWQQMKALVQVGPFNQFKIEAGNILFVPVPPAGQSCTFNYVTKNWTTQGNDGFLTDNDTALLDEDLLTMGVVWRWKKARGFIWQPDHEECEQQIQNAIARDGMATVLNLGGDAINFHPGVMVPSGSWPQVSLP